MKKFNIIHAASGLNVIWEEENIEEVKKILQQGHRTILPLRGNTAFPLTIQNTIIEELK